MCLSNDGFWKTSNVYQQSTQPYDSLLRKNRSVSPYTKGSCVASFHATALSRPHGHTANTVPTAPRKESKGDNETSGAGIQRQSADTRFGGPLCYLRDSTFGKTENAKNSSKKSFPLIKSPKNENRYSGSKPAKTLPTSYRK